MADAVPRAAFGVETIELDLPALVGALGRRLHEAGVPVTPGALGRARAGAHAGAADHAPAAVLDDARRCSSPIRRTSTRSTRCSSRVFGDRIDGDDSTPEELARRRATGRAPRAEHDARRPARASATGAGACRGRHPATSGEDDEAAELEVPFALASDEELLGARASTRSRRTSSPSSTG